MFCHKKKAARQANSIVSQFADQAQELAHQGIEWATPIATETAIKLRPVVEEARVKAAHLADQAQELAHQGIEWATPIASETAERVRPVVDEAMVKAADTKEKVVNDYAPKAKRVAKAAAAAALETEGDFKARAHAVQESATKALEDPKPKRRGRKFLGTVGLIAGCGIAAYYVWVRRQPVEDPWAEAYWEDDAPTADPVSPEAAPEIEEKPEEVAAEGEAEAPKKGKRAK